MEPILQEDLLNYRFLGGISFSPDGSKAAFTVKKADAENNTYTSNIWLRRGGTLRQLTAMNREGTFTWNNDNELLLLTVREDADKKRQEAGEQFMPVYRLYLDGGEAVKLFELPFSASSLKPWKDGLYIAAGTIDANAPELYSASKEEKESYAKERKENKDYEVCDEVPFWFNGMGFINKMRSALFLFDSNAGTATRISPETMDVSGYEILGDRLFYFGEEKVFKSDYKSVMCLYDLISGENRTVRNDKVFSVSGSALLNGRLVLAMSDQKRYGLNEDPDLFFVDPETGREELLLKRSTGLGNATGSDCRLGRARTMKSGKNAVYFTETRGGNAVLRAVDAQGREFPVMEIDGAVDDFDLCEETGEVLTILLKEDALHELYVSSLTERTPVCVSSFNAENLKDKYVARPEHLLFASCNDTIEGWVLKPIDYDPDKTYPAVLDIHGGPKTAYGPIFYHEMQVWASAGYFVLFCNPIGSDGRGDAFADIRGRYGTVEYQNLMDFTDVVMAKYPQIDPERMCVTGGSYGGFMTNWIIGHTARFCCAATQRSISNWISFYGVSDIGEWFCADQQAGNIDDDLEKLWDHSPLKYASNVVTPTLFIHSDQDYRCPLEQGVQLFQYIRSKGVEARLVVFHGENHELSRSGQPKHRLRRLREITDWFDSHAKKERT